MTQQPKNDAIRRREDSEALALSMTDRSDAGILALAQMPEEEFEQRLEVLKKGRDRIQRIKRELMKEDVHYGVIPGTDKPALHKPGAEVLCAIYSLRARFEPEIRYGDGETSPPISVLMRCDLHLGDLEGPVIATGYGSANSWERKYRYRRGERTCPDCGAIGTVIKGKADYGGGWLCWAKKGGCGARWEDDDPAIVGQAVGDVENPDQLDLENTIVKMAEKRAFIGTSLRGTASSDLFTQDEDAIEALEGDDSGPAPERERPPSQSSSSEPTTPEERQQRAELVKRCAQIRTEHPKAYSRATEAVGVKSPPSTSMPTEVLRDLLAKVHELAGIDGSRQEKGGSHAG